MKRVKKSRDNTFVGVTLLIVLLAAFLVFSMAFHTWHVGNNVVGTAPVQTVLPYIGSLKNISYGYLYQVGSKKQIGVVPTDLVKAIYINASVNGADVYVYSYYTGDFSFDLYNMTKYLNDTVNFYYVGFYNSTGSMNMYTVGNGNATRFFIENGTPAIYTPPNRSPDQILAFKIKLVPTTNAFGTWHFCAGFFGSYKNNTNWSAYFYNFSANKADFYNQSMVNIVSENCPAVNVT